MLLVDPAGGAALGTVARVLINWMAAESAKRSSGKVSLRNRTFTCPVRSARTLISLWALRLLVLTMMPLPANIFRPELPARFPIVVLVWSNFSASFSEASI